MDAVGRHQLTTLQTVVDVHCIVLTTILVGFLDATARGCVIMGNGKPYHGTVGQVDGTLDKSFAKGTAPHNDAAVVILNGTRDNLCG